MEFFAYQTGIQLIHSFLSVMTTFIVVSLQIQSELTKEFGGGDINRYTVLTVQFVQGRMKTNQCFNKYN